MYTDKHLTLVSPEYIVTNITEDSRTRYAIGLKVGDTVEFYTGEEVPSKIRGHKEFTKERLHLKVNGQFKATLYDEDITDFFRLFELEAK